MPDQLQVAGLHAEARGPEDGQLVVCVHGLSANLRAFDVLAPALADAGHRVVAVDLRGRGATPDSGPGTYGLAAHARDVLAVAGELGAERFSLVGWSMGALITTTVAEQAGERLAHAVLIDAGGQMDPAAVDAVRAALARLQAVVPDPATYAEAIRSAGAITPWEPFWDAYFRYELAERDDGTWAARTSHAACLEDLDLGVDQDHRARWPALTMPTLLVRCTVPLGGGLLVPETERDGMRAAAAQLDVEEIERNHYGVMTAPRFVEAVVRHVT